MNILKNVNLNKYYMFSFGGNIIYYIFAIQFKNILFMENKDNMLIEALKNLPAAYFKIAALPLPDITFDDYQEIRYDSLGREIINKGQPLGWDKNGIWVGVNLPIKGRKKICRIKEKEIINDNFNDIEIVEMNGVTHIYSTNNNYFNNI